MPSLETDTITIRQTDVIQAARDQIRAHLEAQKARIYEALASYPSPIAACDQQFNYLLEERTRVSQELDRLNGSNAVSLEIEDSIQWIEEFIRSSSYLDAEAGQTIRSYLLEGLSQI